jgi:hypothetical protein
VANLLIKCNRTGASILGELPEVPETDKKYEDDADREIRNRRNRSHLEFIKDGDVTKNIRLHLKLGDAVKALWEEMVKKTYDVFFQLASQAEFLT